jgi:hypothetical protein
MIENKYEVANGLLGLKRDLFIKLTVKEKDEDNITNLFSLYEETNK